MTDVELLQEYVRTRSEPAFAELVHRHLDWVYWAAARQVHDKHLAEDVTQAVFLLLCREGRKVRRSVSGWLFRAARSASLDSLRARKRREYHEQKAAAMRPESSSTLTSEQWDEIKSILEDLVAKLPGKEREAILCRFYQRRSFAEVGQEMGVTDEAARKRVERGIQKLRDLFAKQGLNLSTGALTSGLMTKVTEAPPIGLAAKTLAIASHTTSVSAEVAAITKGAWNMMAWTKLKVAAAVCAASMLVTGAGLAVAVMAMSPAAPPLANSSAATAFGGSSLQPTSRGSTRPATTQVGNGIVQADQQAIAMAFATFQKHLKEENYDGAWDLLAQSLRSQYGNYDRWLQQMTSDPATQEAFLALGTESVARYNGSKPVVPSDPNAEIFVLTAKHQVDVWRFYFIKEEGQWKVCEGQHQRPTAGQERPATTDP